MAAARAGKIPGLDDPPRQCGNSRMAWRIEQAVIRGEIDNTVEGRTTGRIWLAGCDAPLQLSLDGDCWRDLAGTRLHFENPEPRPGPETAGLAVDQTGLI